MGGNIMDKIDLSITVVLGGIMRLPEVRQRYLQLFPKPYDRAFASQGRNAYASVEGVISQCIRADEQVTVDVLMRYMLSHYDKIPPSDNVFKAQYARILEELDKDLKYTPNICLRHLETIAQTKAETKLRSKLLDPTNRGNMQEVIEQYVEDTAKLATTEKLKVYQPFKDRDKLLKKRTRIPTGVSIIDSILQGGIVPGEHMGILGPSAGGKGIIANQLVCNFAIRKIDTLLVQFEQPIDGDVAERMFAYLTGRSINDFRDKSVDQLPPDIQEELEKIAPIMEHIRCISYVDQEATSLRTGPQEIIKDLQEVYDSGFKFKFLLMDWLGAAITGFMRTSSSTLGNYQESAQILMDDINKWAKQHGVTIIWFHQTSTTAQDREPAYQPKREDSYNFKSFCHKLEFCLQLGTPTRRHDGTNVHYLCIGKGRTASLAKDHIVVKMLGEMMRFEEAGPDEFVLNKRGQFVTKKEQLGITDDDYDDDPYLPPKNSVESFINSY